MNQKNNRNNKVEHKPTAERRQYERERARRRRLYYVIIMAVVTLCFVILSLTVFFKITVIQVTGSTNYSSEEIAAASGIVKGDNIIRENISECSRNITSQLIYVETADVKKQFPGTIVIHVEASVPTANVQTVNGYYLISQGGKVLEKLTNPKTGLLTINGAESDITLKQGDIFRSVEEKKTDDIYTLIDAFEKFKLENVTHIDITDRANVSFLYDSRIKVELGVVSDLDYKLNFIAEILTKEIGTNSSGTLRLLPDSAQYIDDAGLQENERVYQKNMETYVREGEETEPPETVTDEEGNIITEETSETEAPEEEETETETAATTME